MTFIAVDGTAIMWRGLFGSPPLSRSDGMVTGSVVYFMRTLETVVSKFQATHIAIAFDGPSGNFRAAMNPQYKRYREARELSADDIVQQKAMRYAARLMGTVIDSSPYEADDVVAACAKQFGGPAIIVAADKDAHQSVSENVSVYDWTKKIVITQKEVRERWSVDAKRVADVQALAGDSVDGVAGVSKFGIKTASALLQDFDSVEHVLVDAASLKEASCVKLISESRVALESARMTRTIFDAKVGDVSRMKIRDDWHVRFASLAKALEASSFFQSLCTKYRTSPKRVVSDARWQATGAIRDTGEKPLFGRM